MKNGFSLFYDLQQKGAQALAIHNVKPGFGFDLAPFVREKLASRHNDPLPVFILNEKDCKTILLQTKHFYAHEGLPSFENLEDQVDRIAASQLLAEVRYNAPLPARRFALELHHDDGGIAGVLIEAIKKDNYATSPEILYGIGECENKTFLDCNLFHIYSFSRRAPDVRIVLDGYCYSFSPSKVITGKELVIVTSPIPTRLTPISKAPPFTRSETLSWEAVMDLSGRAAYTQDMDSMLTLTLDFLAILKREPKLIERQTQTFAEQNRLRRIRKLPAFSPINIMTVDGAELRLFEFRQAAEIADAIKNRGGYNIPGLVLVGPRKNPTKTGRMVEAYAKCKDELVRTEATKLLRDEDYEKLAHLVRVFGNETTKLRFASSELHVVKVV